MKQENRKPVIALAAIAIFALVLLAMVGLRGLDRATNGGPAPTDESQRIDATVSAMSVEQAPQAISAMSGPMHEPTQATDRSRVLNDRSLPPAGTPWRPLVSELMERARAGDKEASDRLYDDTFGCIQYVLTLASARGRLGIEPDLETTNVAQIVRELDGYNSWQSILRDNEATCSQVTQDELYRQMYPIFLAAANNGNERAAVCYASGAYTQPGESGRNNEADLTAWTGNALAFMRAGVRRGDWTMVDLLQTYFDPLTQKLATSYDSRWQAKQFQSDPLKAYRYAALWAVGARVAGDEKDKSRATLIKANFKQRFHFSDAPFQEADQWAEQTYQQYFAGRPWIGGDTTTFCGVGN